MKYAFGLVFALLMTAPVAAQSMSSMTLANNLGTVLASEEFCGLTYNQSAIKAFIEKSVKADDMSFPSTLSSMTMGAKYSLKDMSPSDKTARCAQVARIAKSYGFISQ